MTSLPTSAIEIVTCGRVEVRLPGKLVYRLYCEEVLGIRRRSHVGGQRFRLLT